MAKRSILFAEFERLGAVTTERDGWELADHFGSPEAEYRALTTGAGLFDLSHCVMLQFTGPDRLSFLQGMLSNDLRPLKMFDGQQATILTQQGKVVADVRVLCSLNSFYLDLWDALKEKALTHLNHYRVADEVEISDPNEQWKMLSVQGPKAQSLLAGLFAGAELPARTNGHGMVTFAGEPVCIVRADHSGHDGFDVIVKTEQLLPFSRKVVDSGAAWVGARAQEVLRIEAGIPRYGVDFDEDNLLLEVGLDHAVSFTKGCYLGQEIVERIRSRGHVNRRLCGLLLDGPDPASPADRIKRGDQEVGKITSSVTSPALNRPIALGYVHKDHWAEGTGLTIHHGAKATAATVAALPFVSADRVS